MRADVEGVEELRLREGEVLDAGGRFSHFRSFCLEIDIQELAICSCLPASIVTGLDLVRISSSSACKF